MYYIDCQGSVCLIVTKVCDAICCMLVKEEYKNKLDFKNE